MEKPAKHRFCFNTTEELKQGTTHVDVAALQTILSRFGYLRGSFEPDQFCRTTERAVRRFQRFYHLKPDGIVGPITKGLMETPRCGVTDIPVVPDGQASGAPFVLRGCRYEKNDLSKEHPKKLRELKGRLESYASQAAKANIPPNRMPRDFKIPKAWGHPD